MTDPEPLPADHILWSFENAHVTMHLTGRAQDQMVTRSVKRFLENLDRYGRGEALEPIFEPARGY